MMSDTNDTYISLAAVCIEDPNLLTLVTNRVRKVARIKRPTGEVKFYTSSSKTRRLFLSLLNELRIDVFALVIDKQGKKIPDTPENYAALSSYLLSYVIKAIKSGRTAVFIFDRHFTKKQDLQDFNQALAIQDDILIKHVDSVAHPAVNAADIVAGSVLAYEREKDLESFMLIKRRVKKYKKVTWSHVKAWYIRKKLV